MSEQQDAVTVLREAREKFNSFRMSAGHDIAIDCMRMVNRIDDALIAHEQATATAPDEVQRAPDPPLHYIVSRLMNEFPYELAEDQWRNPALGTVANGMRIRRLLAKKLHDLSVAPQSAPLISAEAIAEMRRWFMQRMEQIGDARQFARPLAVDLIDRMEQWAQQPAPAAEPSLEAERRCDGCGAVELTGHGVRTLKCLHCGKTVLRAESEARS
jgi:hypothetical protein